MSLSSLRKSENCIECVKRFIRDRKLLPQDAIPLFAIHRLGRTGRAGKEGRGLLLLTPWEEVFLRSLNDITITQSKGTEVSPDIEAKVNKALGYIDEDTKSKAYQAWLGYYNSCRLLKWDKQTLVKRANLFSSTLGLRQPPALLKKTVGMMGLRNVPGLTVI